MKVEPDELNRHDTLEEGETLIAFEDDDKDLFFLIGEDGNYVWLRCFHTKIIITADKHICLPDAAAELMALGCEVHTFKKKAKAFELLAKKWNEYHAATLPLL